MLLLAVGCTFAPGAGFGELHEVTLEARFDAGAARDLGDGAFLTDGAYAVTVESMRWELGTIELLELSGGGSATFDPADPPDGYGLCHGGHCHHESGALVDYADIEAELAGGGARFVPVATIPVDLEVDLLDGAALVLVPDDPLLPAAEVSKLTLGAARFQMTGAVDDGADGSWPLTVDLPLDVTLGVGLDLPLDRGHEPTVTLDLALTPSGTLLDELDLAALVAEDAIRLDDVDAAVAAPLVARLQGLEPLPTLTRSPED